MKYDEIKEDVMRACVTPMGLITLTRLIRAPQWAIKAAIASLLRSGRLVQPNARMSIWLRQDSFHRVRR